MSELEVLRALYKSCCERQRELREEMEKIAEQIALGEAKWAVGDVLIERPRLRKHRPRRGVVEKIYPRSDYRDGIRVAYRLRQIRKDDSLGDRRITLDYQGDIDTWMKAEGERTDG